MHNSHVDLGQEAEDLDCKVGSGRIGSMNGDRFVLRIVCFKAIWKVLATMFDLIDRYIPSAFILCGT
jgi:hypothetical protein